MGKIEATFINANRNNGVSTSYYESGKIKSVNSYDPQVDKTYYENGQIKSDLSKIKRAYTEWHINGKIKLTGSLDEGGFGRVGKWSYYDDKGTLVRELFYKANNAGWHGAEKGYYKETKY